jgi:hypothetical protein
MGQVKTAHQGANGGNNPLHHPDIAILESKIRQQDDGGRNFLGELIDALNHRILLISVTDDTVMGVYWDFMLC